MFDIVGDIHGHANELVELLATLGYQERGGCFRHASRKVIFCGDFIDRGPHIPDVVRIAKAMVEGDAALAVMGNHEFNALAYHTERGNGEFFRPHDRRNAQQHAATVTQFTPTELRTAVAWFTTLPTVLDLGNVRVVHACWNPAAIQTIHQSIADLGAFTVDFLAQATQKHNPLFDAMECVLKGPEIPLPDGVTVKDMEGNTRRRVRIRWFDEPHQHTLGSYALPEQTGLSTSPIGQAVRAIPYPTDAPPVFIGHYWLPHARPAPLKHNIACVDYSVARHGLLCAYRFDGEARLSADKFVAVSSHDGLKAG